MASVGTSDDDLYVEVDEPPDKVLVRFAQYWVTLFVDEEQRGGN